MKKAALLQTLHHLASEGIWALSGRALGRLLLEPPENLSVSLARVSREGYILRLTGGFYRNTLADLPWNHLELLANWLRPHEWFYLSLESALHEAGYLQQVPNRLVFITTGRSYIFHTPLGILEFIHTQRDLTKSWNQIVPDWKRGVRVAEPELALADLRRSKRNVGLVKGVEA